MALIVAAGLTSYSYSEAFCLHYLFMWKKFLEQGRESCNTRISDVNISEEMFELMSVYSWKFIRVLFPKTCAVNLLISPSSFFLVK